MLAEKLLAKGDYDCDKEIRTLELLKIRFGEANLLNCEASPLLSPQMLDSTPSKWKGQPSYRHCSSSRRRALMGFQTCCHTMTGCIAHYCCGKPVGCIPSRHLLLS